MNEDLYYCPLCLVLRWDDPTEKQIKICNIYRGKKPDACRSTGWKLVTPDAPPEVLAMVALRVMNPDD